MSTDVVAYDYDALPNNVAKTAKAAAKRIKKRCKRVITDIVENGRDLLKVKDDLAHGEFGKWLKDEFGWSHQTANNYINVALRFGDKIQRLGNLDPQPTAEALYLLSADKVPDTTRDKMLEEAEKGNRIDLPAAKELGARYGGYQYPETTEADKWERFIKWLEKFAAEKSAPVAVARLRELADQLEAQCES